MGCLNTLSIPRADFMQQAYGLTLTGGGLVVLSWGMPRIIQDWHSMVQSWSFTSAMSTSYAAETVLTTEAVIESSAEYFLLLDELHRAKEKANESGGSTGPLHRHHIIAREHPAALIAREIWTIECNMSINHPDNLVYVSAGMHQFMHTEQYFWIVNTIIVLASAMPGNKKENVRTALRVIALAITIVDTGIE